MAANLSATDLVSCFLDGDPPADRIQLWSERLVSICMDLAALNGTLLLTEEEKNRIRSALSARFAHNLPIVCNEHVTVRRMAALAPAFPELVFPLGYDEVRVSRKPVDDPTLSPSAKGAANEALDEYIGLDEHIELMRDLAHLVQYRTPDGVWHATEGLLDALVPPSDANWQDDHRPLSEWDSGFKKNLLAKLNAPQAVTHNVLSLPALQLPSTYGDSLLHTSAKSILGELHNSSKTLEDIHWRTLEEIVAELLFDLGLDVTLTDRSNDGGRDVVARGELIPGEPTLLAVEVKHRRIVPVSELRQALWANRHIPALLFVTSGEFSAGIYKQREEPDGALRLYLKNGVGLTQWIDSYCKRRSPDEV